MTITFELWHIIPALLIISAIVLFWIGGRETGLLAGLFPNMAAVALLLIAAAFMLGRWLA